MDILTTASNSYMHTFSSYLSQFLSWGQWLFFSLVVINIVWICLWHAFDRHSLAESLPKFIKQFFVIALFYTFMMNPNWLSLVMKTAEAMGGTLTHAPIDPSSIISEGIGLGNKIIIPIEKSSLFTIGFGLIIVAIVYIIIQFVFISIALELALRLIITTALISISTFFLGFAALGATSQIARQALDVILGNCVKILGIYLVVAAGSQTIVSVSKSLPMGIASFDAYCWIVAVVLLFWLIAKNLPNQMAKIVSGAIQESRGTDAAALTMAAISYARMAMPAASVASSAVQAAGKIAGSTIFNAGAHFDRASSATGSAGIGLGAAVGGSAAHLGKALTGVVSDHFKNVASKLAGGPGSQKAIKGVSERMYEAGKDIHSAVKAGSTPTSSSTLNPISRPKQRE